MNRAAFMLLLAALPTGAAAAEWTVGVAAGGWQVSETDDNVRTLFEGEPDGFAVGMYASRGVSRNASLVAALDYMQGASVHGIRPRRMGGVFIVDESEWLRSIGLQVGVRLHGPAEWSVSPYLELLAGPTLVWQRLREVRFRDSFTPIDRDEWEFTLQSAGGLEVRASAVTVAVEALWQQFASETVLAQPRVPCDLDRWAVRGKIGFRLGN
jgi:hypothetical protein